MAEEMIKEASQNWTEFFDVFLSYRHHDADRIDDLTKKIEFHGFKVFRWFPRLPACLSDFGATRANVAEP